MHHTHISTLLMAALLAAPPAFSAADAADVAPKLVVEHFMIDAADPGTQLTSSPMMARTHGRCSTTSGTRIFSTPCDIPSYRRCDSNRFGTIEVPKLGLRTRSARHEPFSK
jgi:hypothetical protein